MGSFSKNLALLALGFWLGCAILFALIVTPVLFNPDVTSGLSRSMAGAISGAILRRVYLITYVSVGIATFFLFIASFGNAKGSKGPRRALLLCIFILGLNAISDLWILDQINKVKVEMANSTESRSQILREQFGRWHTVSIWVYGGATFCGLLAALFLLPSAGGGKSKK